MPCAALPGGGHTSAAGGWDTVFAPRLWGQKCARAHAGCFSGNYLFRYNPKAVSLTRGGRGSDPSLKMCKRKLNSFGPFLSLRKERGQDSGSSVDSRIGAVNLHSTWVLLLVDGSQVREDALFSLKPVCSPEINTQGTFMVVHGPAGSEETVEGPGTHVCGRGALLLSPPAAEEGPVHRWLPAASSRLSCFWGQVSPVSHSPPSWRCSADWLSESTKAVTGRRGEQVHHCR